MQTAAETITLPEQRQAPSAEELEATRRHRWALSKRDMPGAEQLLVSGSCAICHGKLAREYTIEGNFLVVTPWLHEGASAHPAAVED